MEAELWYDEDSSCGPGGKDATAGVKIVGVSVGVGLVVGLSSLVVRMISQLRTNHIQTCTTVTNCKADTFLSPPPLALHFWMLTNILPSSVPSAPS